MRSITTILLMALAWAAPSGAWNKTGHLVVARIAWEEMSPAARDRAAELLAAAPADSGLRQLLPRDSRSPESRRAVHFQNAAYWPDIVRDGAFPERRDKYHHSDWHWINYFFETRGPERTPFERTDLEPQGRIVERLETLVPTLGDPDRPEAERAIHLAWVLHLVGDVHQPLHATARVTKTEPQGDRGGNLFQLNGKRNLHWFWDSILQAGHFRWFFQSDDSYARQIADAILKSHSRSVFGDRALSRDYQAWARDSFVLARDNLYPAELERGRRPTRAYTRMALSAAEVRVALAGYRLASILESELGAPTPDAAP